MKNEKRRIAVEKPLFRAAFPLFDIYTELVQKLIEKGNMDKRIAKAGTGKIEDKVVNV